MPWRPATVPAPSRARAAHSRARRRPTRAGSSGSRQRLGQDASDPGRSETRYRAVGRASQCAHVWHHAARMARSSVERRPIRSSSGVMRFHSARASAESRAGAVGAFLTGVGRAEPFRMLPRSRCTLSESGIGPRLPTPSSIRTKPRKLAVVRACPQEASCYLALEISTRMGGSSDVLRYRAAGRPRQVRGASFTTSRWRPLVWACASIPATKTSTGPG